VTCLETAHATIAAVFKLLVVVGHLAAPPSFGNLDYSDYYATAACPGMRCYRSIFELARGWHCRSARCIKAGQNFIKAPQSDLY
jgi:hypothetical protein